LNEILVSKPAPNHKKIWSWFDQLVEHRLAFILTQAKMIHAAKNWVLSFFALPVGFRKTVFHGLAWGTVGLIATRLFSVIGFILLARSLGRSDFGSMSMIRSTVFLFGVVAGAGLPQASTRFISQVYKSDLLEAWRYAIAGSIVQIIFAFISFSLIWAAAPWLASSALKRPDLILAVRLGAVLLVASSATATIRGMCQGFHQFHITAIIDTGQGIGLLIFGVAGAMLNGVAGALIGLSISWIVAAGVGLLMLFRRCGTNQGLAHCFPNRSCLWRLAAFSFPIGLSALLLTPVSWLANTMLFRLPNGDWEMGAFRSGEQFRNTLLYLPNLLTGVLLPVLSASNMEKEKSGRFLAINVYVVGYLGGAGAVVLSCFASLIQHLYGKDFAGIELVLVGVFFTGAFAGPNNILSTGLLASGRAWTSFLMGCFQSLVLLVSAYFLVPHFHAVGFALAFVLSHLANSIALLLVFRREGMVQTGVRVLIGHILALAVCLAVNGPQMCLISTKIGASLLLLLLQFMLIPPWVRRACLDLLPRNPRLRQAFAKMGFV
jgi:O-antigen/teichoic acid export membrane protein